MNKKMLLGFYSILITRVFYVATFLMFLCFSYYSVDKYYNNCKKIILDQNNFFSEKWKSKVDFFSYTLKDNFLPQMVESIKHSPLNKQKELLKRFKASVGYNSAIEDIFLLNSKFVVIDSSNSNDNYLKNISLSDRDYMKKSYENPKNIQYSTPHIGKISGKLSFHISIAILNKNKIDGYIVLRINLETLSNNFISNKISDNLEKISFITEDLPPSSNKIKLEDFSDRNIDTFLYLLVYSYRDPYLIVEMDAGNNHPKVFFVYNLINISKEFLKSYLTGISLLSFLLFVFSTILWLYKKYVLEPIAGVHRIYESIQNRYNIISDHSVDILYDSSKSEIGNIKQLNNVGNLIITKLETDDYAIKLTLEYNRFALEHLRIKSVQLNEAIDDLVYNFKNEAGENSSKNLLQHLSDLYNLGTSNVHLIEVYKKLEDDILPTLTEGKVLVSISEVIEQVGIELSCHNFEIKIMTAHNDSLIYNLLLYKSPFNNTIQNVVNYLKECHGQKSTKLEIFVQNSLDNKSIIINFVINQNKLKQSCISQGMLEEAKIYSLFNCSVLREKFDTNLHQISIILPHP